ASVRHKTGAAFAGELGYDFGVFRLEGEIGYKTNRNKAVIGSDGVYRYTGGKARALSAMLNGLVDFGDDDSLQGFVGGGVGIARVTEYVPNSL
ncbi:outer membrane protein, partial [Salmonella enterica]|uniref:outer membrane protein n=1 Tax=Salmonella enterica TaxID=28901 RepID=UPI003D2A4424